METSRRLGAAFALVCLPVLAACGASPASRRDADTGPPLVSGAGASAAGGETGGPGGSSVTSGEAGAAGATSSGGSGPGSAGVSGGPPDGGTPDASAPDASPDDLGTPGADGAPPVPFTCNQVTGLYTSGQWFDAGFEMDGLDGAHWQSKVQKYAYIEKWADPNNGVWNQAIKSACTEGSTAPDRIVFVIFSPDTKPDEPTMEMLINKVLVTLKAKYPSAREIDLLTMSRAPGNVMCPNNNDPWTVVGAYVDQAIAAVVVASNGFVVAGPKYYVPDCTHSYSVANDTDFTQSAATAIAQMIAPYYVAHP